VISQRLPVPAQSASPVHGLRATQVPEVQVWLAWQDVSSMHWQRSAVQVNLSAQSASVTHSGGGLQTPERQTWLVPQSESVSQIGPHAPRRQRWAEVQSESVEQGVEFCAGQAQSKTSAAR
jgi:hypothetical protein